MSTYNGQIVAQQYAVEMGNSPAGMQRVHSSPQQQQQTHMIQPGQMLAQQQMMMQTNQPMHMPPCSSMQVQMAPMGPPQMISQQGVAIMSQQGHMQQAGNAQTAMMQSQHQMIAAAAQISPQQQQQQQQQQQMPAQIVVTSMGQQQMLSAIGPQVQQQPQPQPQQQPQPQVSHQMGPATTPHLGPQQPPPPMQPQPPQAQQHQMMSLQQQQQQQQQQQNQVQHSVNVQQAIGHSPSFVHPNQPHMHTPNPNYQQPSPHRATMTRYPTQNPENMQHTNPMYRSPVQRSSSTPRIIGQSSAIRQALGHLPSAAASVAVQRTAEKQPSDPNSMRLLNKEAFEALVKTVDPLEAVEDDVTEALLQLIEEFVDDVVEQTARVAQHRSSPKVEVKDVKYVLERKYKIFLPPTSASGSQPVDQNPYEKSPTTEAHRQRMALIKKGIQKP